MLLVCCNRTLALSGNVSSLVAKMCVVTLLKTTYFFTPNLNVKFTTRSIESGLARSSALAQTGSSNGKDKAVPETRFSAEITGMGSNEQLLEGMPDRLAPSKARQTDDQHAHTPFGMSLLLVQGCSMFL